jgi:phage baseplate assembly protein W
MTTTNVDVVWSDLDHRFILDSRGGVKLVTNTDAVKTSLDNILRTSPGERCFRPAFGFGLGNRMIGESMSSTALDMIASEAKRIIEAWDPRIEILESSFYKYPDSNTIFFGLTCRIRSQAETFTYETAIRGED